MKSGARRHVRGFARGGLGWIFGLSITIFLISIWGRSVVVDTETLAESLSPMGGSAPVVSLLTDWLRDELTDAGAAPSDETVEAVLDEPDVAEVMDRLVAEIVLASGSTSGGEAVVDVASILRPAAEAIAGAVSASTGLPVSTSDVTIALDQVDPLVVRSAGEPPTVGSASPIAGRLGTAAFLAVLTFLVAGWGVVSLSEDRNAAIKGLLTRVSLGALSFAVMLRIGSWVLSPSGGRAPISETLSALMHSKWMVPLTIGLIAGAGALAFWTFRKRSETDPVEGAVQDRGRGQEPGVAAVVIEPALTGDPTED